MSHSREPVLIPYGRPISLRIHPALLVRLDHEVDRLNRARPPREMTRSGLIQQALRLFLDGPTEPTRAQVQATSISGVPEADRQWQANGATLIAGPKDRETRRRGLWRRFEQICDRDQITPPDWLRLAAQHDPNFDRAMLLAWYRVGELPEGQHSDRLMNLVQDWLESS